MSLENSPFRVYIIEILRHSQIPHIQERNNMKRILFTMALAAAAIIAACVQTGKGNNSSGQTENGNIVSLSGPGWKLWRDTEAKWQSEKVVVPGTPLDQVTAHLPTGGWDALNKAERKDVVVPGTVEQYFTDMSALEKDYTIDPKNFWQPLQGVSW